MLESGTPGSVVSTGAQPPVANRPESLRVACWSSALGISNSGTHPRTSLRSRLGTNQQFVGQCCRVPASQR